MSYETYDKVKVLGKGSFGKAFLVKAKSDDVCSINYIETICDKTNRSRRNE